MDGEQWCARRLLSRIHSYTQKRLRREIEPVTAQDLMRFLLRWQHVAPGTQRQGRSGLMAVIEQLQGFELPAGTWESQVFPSRIEHYRPAWLDELCHSGQVAWGRIKVRDSVGEGESAGGAGAAAGAPGRAVRPATSGTSGRAGTGEGTPGTPGTSGKAGTGGGAPGSGTAGPLGPGPVGGGPRMASITSRATPITLLLRADLAWLLQSARGDAIPAEPSAGASHDIIEALRECGALFLPELAAAARRLPAEVETALWDGVARGLLTADGFSAVRSLLAGRQVASHRDWQARRGLRRGISGARAGAASAAATGGGRWSLLPVAGAVVDRDSLAEAVAEQLLARWGVVFRDIVARETLAIPWRDVLWALRRMEARGTVRGGRFVTGFSGEQYASPEAVEQLRSVRRTPRTGETVHLSATDPLNLVGIITPGPRVPAVRTNTVTYVDGLPHADSSSQVAVAPAS